MACFTCHFSLILLVSCRDTFAILARGYTYLPSALEGVWRNCESAASAALGHGLSISNPLRQSVNSYLNSAGIERGYALFAPGVPNSHKLVFELHFADGRIEYQLPRSSGDESNLRVASLLDSIGRTTYEPLREVVFKMMASAVWRDHPDATMIRAVFGEIVEPTAAEAALGKKESYRFLHAYEFSFEAQPSGPPKH